METVLLRHFINHKTEQQTLGIESQILNIDYAGINKIELTKYENHRRYS